MNTDMEVKDGINAVDIRIYFNVAFASTYLMRTARVLARIGSLNERHLFSSCLLYTSDAADDC